MSKLNPVKKQKPVAKAYSKNGNLQDVKSDAQQFYEIVVGTLYGKDGFYESTDERFKRMTNAIGSLVAKDSSDYIANVIYFARTEMLIRSMPILATVVFAKALRDSNKSFPHLRGLVASVIQRADQLTDMYAVALGVFGSKGKVPMAIKRGVADAMNKFSEHQFAKYNRKAGVTLRDLLRIVHPEPKDPAQGEIFKKIMEDSLAVPYTWETELSTNGQKTGVEQKSKDQLWSELVLSGKMGYMALLRNLRNIGESVTNSNVINTVVSKIADPKAVANGKQFPMSYIKALDAVQGTKVVNSFSSAIRAALDASAANLPSIGTKVWVIVDCSGSMLGKDYYQHTQTLRQHGHKALYNLDSPYRTAAVLAGSAVSAAKGATDIAITLFSDYAETIKVHGGDSVTSVFEAIAKRLKGGGTNLQAALDQKRNLGFEPDTVIVLSDMEVNQLHVRNLDTIFPGGIMKIAINLASGVSTPIGERQGFLQLAGYSDNLYKLIPMLRDANSNIERLFSSTFVPQ